MRTLIGKKMKTKNSYESKETSHKMRSVYTMCIALVSSQRDTCHFLLHRPVHNNHGTALSQDRLINFAYVLVGK